VTSDRKPDPVSRPDIAEVEAKASVGPGAIDLCIPPLVAKQLKLSAIEQHKVTTAHGRKQSVGYVGPVKVEVFGRHAFAGGMVIGDVVLLEVIPVEAMDLLIHPAALQLMPNPAHPSIPASLAKGVRPAGTDNA